MGGGGRRGEGSLRVGITGFGRKTNELFMLARQEKVTILPGAALVGREREREREERRLASGTI